MITDELLVFGVHSTDQEVIEDYYQSVLEDELLCCTEKPSQWPVVRSLLKSLFDSHAAIIRLNHLQLP